MSTKVRNKALGPILKARDAQAATPPQERSNTKVVFLRELHSGTYGNISLVQYIDQTKSPEFRELRVTKRMNNRAQCQVDREKEQVERRCVHPNVVKYYHYSCDAGCHCTEVTMEFMDMGSVVAVQTKMNDLEKEGNEVDRSGVAAAIGFQLFMALDYFHNFLGGMHRDIKPGNILVHSTGRVKICDFDTSVVDGMPHDTNLGTPSYLAPEVVRLENQSSAIDIWAAGTVLFELATGRHPYPCSGSLRVAQGISGIVPTEKRIDWTPTAHLPNEMKDLLQSCMRDDPATRITAAEALRHPAFGSILHDSRHNLEAEKHVERIGIRLSPRNEVCRNWKAALAALASHSSVQSQPPPSLPLQNSEQSVMSPTGLARAQEMERAESQPQQPRPQRKPQANDVSNLMKSVLYNWEYGSVKWLREWLKEHVHPIYSQSTAVATGTPPLQLAQ